MSVGGWVGGLVGQSTAMPKQLILNSDSVLHVLMFENTILQVVAKGTIVCLCVDTPWGIGRTRPYTASTGGRSTCLKFDWKTHESPQGSLNRADRCPKAKHVPKRIMKHQVKFIECHEGKVTFSTQYMQWTTKGSPP